MNIQHQHAIRNACGMTGKEWNPESNWADIWDAVDRIKNHLVRVTKDAVRCDFECWERPDKDGENYCFARFTVYAKPERKGQMAGRRMYRRE